MGKVVADSGVNWQDEVGFECSWHAGGVSPLGLDKSIKDIYIMPVQFLWKLCCGISAICKGSKVPPEASNIPSLHGRPEFSLTPEDMRSY